MPDSIFLYFRYFAVSVRGQMQYRASFVMQSFGMFCITGIEFLAIWTLFDRFGSIRGWRLPEIAFFYGMIQITWSFADAMGRGFDLFGGMVKNGDFDRILLRPRAAALQIAATELTLRRVGRLVQGLIVLLWAASQLDVVWSPMRIILMLTSICAGICLFIGILILQATLSFWAVESLEIMNTITYGGVETMQYPLPIYQVWFRRFFIFVVPLACVSYFPIVAILGRSDPLGSARIFQWLSPALGFAFLAVSLQIWGFGVKRYCSTGN